MSAEPPLRRRSRWSRSPPRGAHAVCARAAAPAVQSMIVGSSGAILSQPRTVLASASTVRVGTRTAPSRRARRWPCSPAVRAPVGRFALRDYGHCGSSPRNSGQLFVYCSGASPTAGRTAGSTRSTASPAAPARAIRAAPVATAGCCARVSACCGSGARPSAVAASARSKSRRRRRRSRGALADGHRQRLRQRRPARPVAGAIVTLGSDFASTRRRRQRDAGRPSAPGRYQVSATRRGLVPSFPETIVVR